MSISLASSAKHYKKRVTLDDLQINPFSPLNCDVFFQQKQRHCATPKRPGSRVCQTHHMELVSQCPTEQYGELALRLLTCSLATGVTAAESMAESSSRVHKHQIHAIDDVPSDSNPTQVTPAIRLRIPCPLNPNHTIYEHQLERHLTVCPDRRFIAADLPYYSRGLHACVGQRQGGWLDSNTREIGSEEQSALNRHSTKEIPEEGSFIKEHRNLTTHRDLSEAELQALTEKVNKVYDQYVIPSLVPFLHNELLLKQPWESEGTDFTKLSQTAKHDVQQQAIIRTLAAIGYLNYDGAKASKGVQDECGYVAPTTRIFVEMGAGKGGVGAALATAVVPVPCCPHGSECNASSSSESSVPKIMVVDRTNFRRKADCRLRREPIPLLRLRLDIQDLDFSKALAVEFDETFQKKRCRCGADEVVMKTSPRDMVVVGKHVCGAATDFALSCALQAGGRLQAIVILTCCHHLCDPKHVIPPQLDASGNDINKNSMCFGLTPREFSVVRAMAAWATSGEARMPPEKIAFGRKCKRIIDAYRCRMLQQASEFGPFKAEMWEIIPETVTPENVAIVAWRRAGA